MTLSREVYTVWIRTREGWRYEVFEDVVLAVIYGERFGATDMMLPNGETYVFEG